MNLSIFRHRPDLPSNEWFIAYTSKFLFFKNLIRSAIEHNVPIWLPSYDVLKADGHDVIKTYHFIYPGYIFFHGINNAVVLVGAESAMGFRILPCPEKPYFLSEEEMDAMKRATAQLTSSVIIDEEYTDGDYVRLLSGPFKHLVGKIESIEGQKITLSVQCFARTVKATTDFFNVQKVHEHESKV